MSTRTELADALNPLEGITAHPYASADTDPGTVLIRLDRTEYPDRFGGVAFWNVILILPQDIAEAEAFAEAHRDPIRTALAPHLAVTSAVPTRLDLPGVGILPSVFFNGHREAD